VEICRGHHSFQNNFKNRIKWTTGRDGSDKLLASETNFQLNSLKCKDLHIDFSRHRHTDNPITVNDQAFKVVQSPKILGVTIRQDLKWNDHVTEITQKASKRLYLLRILKRTHVDVHYLVQFYCTRIRLILEYACQTFRSNLPVYLRLINLKEYRNELFACFTQRNIMVTH
jgi:hypothetical protein